MKDPHLISLYFMYQEWTCYLGQPVYGVAMLAASLMFGSATVSRATASQQTVIYTWRRLVELL